MNSISYSLFRSCPASFLDKVNDDHQALLITRRNGKPAVLMSLEDFKSYEETFYLMASPENSKRLKRSIDQIEFNKAKK